MEYMIKQVKLVITDSQARESFLEHLSSLDSAELQLVYIVAGDAVVLEFDQLYYYEVYYESFSLFVENNPIIALGLNAIFEELTEWDKQELDMKRFIL
ncbi:hypothetical protein KUA24_7 [Vibrio phage HNL01]|nr:hypothetical protein KUA24_7 [Vibrio phage HNL01]